MTSSYLTIVNPAEDCELPTGLACPFPFPLDPFQKHAVKAIHEGHNVLVTAKTGSGKTLVGEYLIHHLLRQGKRVFYTTPIKSLSNQKFHDLKQIFPSVGILTGDIKYRPDAQILIMTTEILRNLLYKDGTATASLGLTASISLEGLGGVVFDEVHYINDPERGKVWEETMILLKPSIQLVLLSATIDHPELFAHWLAELKQKQLFLLSTTYRIVPLVHQVLIGDQPQTIMDNSEVFYDDVYRKWLDWRISKRDSQEAHKRQVAARKAGGWNDPVVKHTNGLPSFPHQLNACIRMLDTKQLMPALFFVFSRAGCEKYAGLVEGSVITSSETAAIQHIWDFHLHPYKQLLEHLPQAHQLLALCRRGIAYHHSGLLPMLREIVEILFGKGLLKCLFATETFAVGINMPTKTVVFLDLEKYSDESAGLRLLRTDEYTQMAGRAGRRGKDTVGYVFYLPQREPIALGEAKQMLTGRKSPISSQMDFGYDFILKTLQAKNLQWMDLMEHSYWFQQRERQKTACAAKIHELQDRIAKQPLSETLKEQCRLREDCELRIQTTGNAKRKEAQKELERLKNKQVGPTWEAAWKTWLSMKALESELQTEKETYAMYTQGVETVVQPRLSLLRSWGFLTDDNSLTPLGISATELNEGHPILMSRAFTEGVWETMSPEELLAFLAAFLTEGKSESATPLSDIRVPSCVKDALWEVDEWAYVYEKNEKAANVPSSDRYWNLSTDWMELAYRWVQGEHPTILCQEYGVYEGNFMRTLLKLANILDEWTNLATFWKTIPLLTKLEGLREKVVRDIVKPESLYLQL
jgi:superfamily II RNA helicase